MPRATYPIPQRRYYPWRRSSHIAVPGEAPLGSANWYVTTLGDDTHAGTTQATAFRTLARAALAATTAGDVVAVGPGTYSLFDATADGSAGARITYRSVYKWGAKIVGTGTQLLGDYTDFIDFDLSDPLLIGASNCLIIVDGVSSRVIGCHFHDWPRPSGTSSAALLLEGWVSPPGDYLAPGQEAWYNVIHGIGSGAASSIGGHGLYVSTPDNVVVGNIVYDCKGDCITSWHAATRLICVNNTVDGGSATTNNGGILLGQGDQGGTTAGHTGAYVANNVVTNNRQYAILEQSDTPAVTANIHNTYRNNLIFNNNPLNDNGGNVIGTYDGGLGVRGTLTGDPLYVVAASDFHLQSTSPAVDSGDAWSTSNPTLDLDSAVRPQGLVIDRGAYEFASVTAVDRPNTNWPRRRAGATR